jgi:hypothetical protein
VISLIDCSCTSSYNLAGKYKCSSLAALPLLDPASTSTSVTPVAANANLAPLGPYMLLLIDDSGPPSVAKIVTVGQ